jgi:predicted RNase H-like HicB family nuclease
MISFKIETDGEQFHAWSPELPGCHTYGRTQAEALKNLKDAVQLYLEDVMDEALLNAEASKVRAKPGRRRTKAA